MMVMGAEWIPSQSSSAPHQRLVMEKELDNGGYML
jgi:hypothetical protein